MIERVWLIRWRWPLDSPLYQRSADTVRASRMSEVIKQKVLKPHVPHCWYLTRVYICSGGAIVSNNGFNSVSFTLPSLVIYQKYTFTQDGNNQWRRRLFVHWYFGLGQCLRTPFLPHEPRSTTVVQAVVHIDVFVHNCSSDLTLTTWSCRLHHMEAPFSTMGFVGVWEKFTVSNIQSIIHFIKGNF